MNFMTQRIIKLALIVTLGISYFILHTALTVILNPETAGQIFLIAVFGFIAKGLEYFVTISSDGKAPWVSAMVFRIGGYAIPLTIFMEASIMDAFGFGRELRQTSVCILVLLCFNMMKKIAEFLVEDAYRDDNDDD